MLSTVLVKTIVLLMIFAVNNAAALLITSADAVRKALKKAGWELKDVELIEANEAFAAQSLSVAKELGFNKDIVNMNGGGMGIAICVERQ